MPYKCVCITINESCKDTEKSLGLPEDNMVIITEGKLEINLFDESFTAETNDILFIPGNTPHSFKNANTQRCISFWFALQPLKDN